MRVLLLLHALLLLLASTDFTIVTALTGHDSFRWCYFRYSSWSGFGVRYVSGFTLPVVLTYIACFAVGVVAYSLAMARGRTWTGAVGLVLSGLGLASFLLEGSHWVAEHNRSWLAFSPLAMLVVCVVALLPSRGAPLPQSAE